MKQNTFTIISTYVNRSKQVATGSTGIRGGDTEIAMHHFNQHVATRKAQMAEGKTWRGVPINTLSIVLIDAAENVIAEWYKPVEAAVAA